MKRSVAWLTVFLLMMSIVGCRPAPVQTPPPAPTDANGVGTTTLMIYMIGSEKEATHGLASADLDEIAAAGIDLSVANVVVCAGGTKRWQSDDISRRKLSTLLLTADGFEEIAADKAASMGEAATLCDFLTRSVQQYPADNYALILWGTGNGPLGGCGDDALFDGDPLLLTELKSALLSSPFTNGNTLRFIGFDAGLMASVETACVLDDHADYLIASPDVISADGWDYTSLASIGRVPTLTLADRVIAATVGDHPEATLSCLDLSQTAALESAINALFSAADASFDTLGGRIAAARADARRFGDDTCDLVDPIDLCERLSTVFPDETAVLASALDKLIVGTDGVSLYYPYHAVELGETRWQPLCRELNIFEAYAAFIRRATADRTPLLTTVPAADGLTLTLSDEQAAAVADATLYVLTSHDDGSFSVAAVDNRVDIDGNTLTARFDGHALYITNDLNDRFLPTTVLRDTADHRTRFTLPLTMSNDPVVWGDMPDDVESLRVSCTAVVTRDDLTNDVTLTAVSAALGDKSIPVDLSRFTEYLFVRPQPFFPTERKDGGLAAFDEWTPAVNPTAASFNAADTVRFVSAPLEAGTYYLSFELTDRNGGRCMTPPTAWESTVEHPAPITPAPVAVSWDDNGTTLYDGEEATVSLNAREDGTLSLTLTNHGEQRLALTADALTVDGVADSIQQYAARFSASADASADTSLMFENAALSHRHGVVITMTLTLQDSLTRQTLVNDLYVTITL